MKQLPDFNILSEDRPRAAIRVGYDGSGMSWVLVRCHDEGAFRQFWGDRNELFPSGGAVPRAFSRGCWVPAIEGIEPHGREGLVYETITAVIADEDSNREFRTWAHEFAHVAEWSARSISPARFSKGFHLDPSEIGACVSEFLHDALRNWANDTGKDPVSQLPDELPWLAKKGTAQ